MNVLNHGRVLFSGWNGENSYGNGENSDGNRGFASLC